jgi:radical SAM-linked protein
MVSAARGVGAPRRRPVGCRGSVAAVALADGASDDGLLGAAAAGRSSAGAGEDVPDAFSRGTGGSIGGRLARVDGPSAAPAGAPSPASVAPPARPAEAVQRWRLTVRRDADAPGMGQREQQAAWEGSLLASGLPVALADGESPRPRVVSGAPLTHGMASDAELYEVFLTRRCPIWEVREALAGSLPEGHALLDLEDVWLGEASLPGRVVGAVYEAGAAGPGASRDALTRAISGMLAASTLPRERVKGERRVAYDLRPFVDALAVLPDADGPEGVRLSMRLRHDPEKGIGRPEEVIAELADRVGPFDTVWIRRTALVLAEPKGVERAASPVVPRGPRRR